MKKHTHRHMALKYSFFVLLLLPTLFGSVFSAPLNILTTTGIIADTASIIGGNKIKVTALMGPGVDPHLYRAIAGDVGRMIKADIILYNGLHLEAGLQKVFEKLKNKATAVTKELNPNTLIPWNNTHDPHVWMDVSIWMKVSRTIERILSINDPANAPVFKRNLNAYLKKLERLHQSIKQNIAKIPDSRRVLITAHDAFAYYGRTYGIEVRALMGISTVTEANTRDVQTLSDFIVKRKISALFIENSIPVKHIEAIQKSVEQKGFAVAVGGELYSDSLGTAGTPEGTYIGMLTHNTNTIVNALK